MIFICETCGTHVHATQQPADCRICSDERQYVGWKGQVWLSPDAMRRTHRNRLEDDGGLLGVGVTPAFGIDQRALILPTDLGNIMWESVSVVTPEAVARLNALGGIAAIAISHPHFYAAMAEWSEALGDVPILLHEKDAAWVQCPTRNIRFWSGARHALSPTVTLIHCGGHFAGSTALHWRVGPRPGGALFPGDAVQVVADRRHLTFMYSYPNYIPMSHRSVRYIEGQLAADRFEDIYGYTWGRNVIGDGKSAVARSIERFVGSAMAPSPA